MVKGIVKNLQVINRITLRDEILCVRRIVDIFSLQTMITYPETNNRYIYITLLPILFLLIKRNMFLYTILDL